MEVTHGSNTNFRCSPHVGGLDRHHCRCADRDFPMDGQCVRFSVRGDEHRHCRRAGAAARMTEVRNLDRLAEGSQRCAGKALLIHSSRMPKKAILAWDKEEEFTAETLRRGEEEELRTTS